MEEIFFNIFPGDGDDEFTVKFEVSEETMVELHVFDLSGVKVSSIISGRKHYPGIYVYPVDVSALSEGSYLVMINLNGIQKSEKLQVIK